MNAASLASAAASASTSCWCLEPPGDAMAPLLLLPLRVAPVVLCAVSEAFGVRGYQKEKSPLLSSETAWMDRRTANERLLKTAGMHRIADLHRLCLERDCCETQLSPLLIGYTHTHRCPTSSASTSQSIGPNPINPAPTHAHRPLNKQGEAMASGEDDFAAFLAEVNEAKPIEEGQQAEAAPTDGRTSTSSPAAGKRARGKSGLQGEKHGWLVCFHRQWAHGTLWPNGAVAFVCSSGSERDLEHETAYSPCV